MAVSLPSFDYHEYKCMSGSTNKDPFLSELGNHVRFLRKKTGLSQEEIADRAGIHVTYLSGIERGLS
jgi:ribosome-binding protein aMBF1 (putative translation factor)